MLRLTRFIYVLMLLFIQIDIESADEWTLVFEDNFDGPEIDESTWTKTRSSHSDQLQYYNESNAYIEDGVLVLKTEHKPTTVDGRDYLYQSGIIQSKGKVDTFVGGKFEIRAKLSDPEFKRLHSAIWLQKTEGSCYQEIDIMEYWTGRKTGGKFWNHVKGAYHFNHENVSGCGVAINPRGVYEYPYWPNGNNRGGHGPLYVNCSDPNNPYLCTDNGTWHEHFSNWTLVVSENESITWYIDGVELAYVNSSDGTMPYQPMYLIINNAVCNKTYCLKYGDLVYDKIGYFYIDYVRVYVAKPEGHSHYISSNGNYIGVEMPGVEERTWSQANDYCKDVFGTQLATVLEANDHNEINSSLLHQFPSSWYVWIGWRDYDDSDIWLPCTSSDCTSETDECSASDEVSASWHNSEARFDTNECGTIRIVNGFGQWFDKPCTDKKDFICNAPHGKYGNGFALECSTGSSANLISYRNPMNEKHVEFVSEFDFNEMSGKHEWYYNYTSFSSILLVICMTLIWNICAYSLIYILYILCIRTGSNKYTFVDNKEEVYFVDE